MESKLFSSILTLFFGYFHCTILFAYSTDMLTSQQERRKENNMMMFLNEFGIQRNFNNKLTLNRIRKCDFSRNWEQCNWIISFFAL